jgi:hypothetical protein
VLVERVGRVGWRRRRVELVLLARPKDHGDGPARAAADNVARDEPGRHRLGGEAAGYAGRVVEARSKGGGGRGWVEAADREEGCSPDNQIRDLGMLVSSEDARPLSARTYAGNEVEEVGPVAAVAVVCSS